MDASISHAMTEMSIFPFPNSISDRSVREMCDQALVSFTGSNTHSET